ncbi:MAG: RNA methyltransferase [Bacteroidales bacterium]|nr:RNA methyltransferase [Bacteroidales bacterium]
MITKNKISKIKLLHQKKFRELEGLFIVEGTKSILELLKSDFITTELWATNTWLDMYAHYIAPEIEISPLTPAELERISILTTPQEVLAIAKMPQPTATDLNSNKPLIVLDDIRDPGNLGTIIRTADWFGIRQILASPQSVEFTNPKTIQATMGSFTRVKVVYKNIADYLSLRQDHPSVIGAFMDGTPISKTTFQNNSIIIIGNEANGISKTLFPFINQKVTIPAYDQHTESLNASIAAAIFMYKLSL